MVLAEIAAFVANIMKRKTWSSGQASGHYRGTDPGSIGGITGSGGSSSMVTPVEKRRPTNPLQRKGN